MRGQQIHTLSQLQTAVDEKRSVTVPGSPCWAGPIPAAFMIHQQARILLRLFTQGMYMYEKPTQKKETENG